MHVPYSTPKTYFQFRVFTNGLQLHESDPLAFDSVEDAWHEGALTACELIRGMHGKIEADLDWRLDVCDGDGIVIYRFSFKAKRL
ncbi:MAG: hypothetical protein H7312_05200 [Tardiphaga sp.]|nr:hypothetical protein [Tardiphaga sp.]